MKNSDACCLCGSPATDDDPITREHVPPKQFYPEPVRAGLNLWVVPTHRSCNNKHKLDEEYFYHATYPLVANNSPRAASIIFDDLKRRARKPQTPALLRSILQSSRTTTEGGVLLPLGVVEMHANTHRIQHVAIKIGRCLFYLDNKRFMPYEKCIDIRLCENEEAVPELYRLSWEMSKANVNAAAQSEVDGVATLTKLEAGASRAVCRQVFDYRTGYFAERRLHLYTMRFWEAFMFCVAFEEPGGSIE